MKATRTFPRFILAISLMSMIAPVQAQERMEFMVISVHGQVRKWMLPADWQPVFSGGYLLLGTDGRTDVSEIAAIRPKRPEGMPGNHELRLTFPVITGKEITYSFQVPDAYARIEDAPREGDFYRIDDQTMIRVGGFTALYRK